MKLPEPIRALFDALRRLWRWIWDPWLNWLAGLPLSRKLINWVEARPRVHAGVTWLGRYWAYIALPLLAVLFSVKAVSLSRLVDDRLAEGVFANTTNVYASPSLIGKGDATTPRALADSLIESGYSDIASNPVGYFRLYENSIEIHPGPQSYFEREPARVTFKGGKISEIRAIQTGETSNDLLLEPVLLANLSGEARERRRLVRYADLPPDLIHAVLSIEDKHFFEHHGFDLLRILKSVLVNLRSGRKEQGGSTLTMQFARNIWLGSEKTWSRKFDEALITIILELRLKKEEILELYANQVYLGQRDTFALHGFGEASQAFFNKEAKRLTLPEAALLAGIIQRPSAFDPIRHPEEATERRNTVLALMHRNEYITEDQMRAASAAPLGLSPRIGDAEVAPYFLALAREEFRARLGKQAWKSGIYRIYTTLDQGLQRAAVEAVNQAMPEVDKRLEKKVGKQALAGLPRPQVALVALDPKTGEIKAALGGRDYTSSQLNRLLAMRQPGSTFKPFVYAAALGGPKGTGSPKFTLATIVEDEPTIFKFGDEIYEPSNFGDKYLGPVNFRTALAKSLNNATVSVAEQAGYKRVAEIARKAGMKSVRATPSLALGAYEVTPVELAGSYTVFANLGDYVEPTFLAEVRDENGKPVHKMAPMKSPVLDPKIAYLMLQLMQGVVTSGTAAGAGINFPAAGKTGTSRDGWFAGFTNGLVCVVWVGFDDNRELVLEGAHSALLVWAEFMKRAVKLGDYAQPWPGPPAGLASADINPVSGKLASRECAETRTEWFVAGTEPQETCRAGDDIIEDEEIEETGTVTTAHGQAPVHR